MPTTVLNETFDTASNFVASVLFFSDGSGDYFGINDGAGSGDYGAGSDPSAAKAYTGFNGSYLEGMDLDGEGAGLPITLTWSGLNIAGLTNLSFSGKFAEFFDSPGDIDPDDFILLEYRIDGGAWTNLLAFEGADFSSSVNGIFRQDTDFNGEGDGTALGNAAQTFTAAIAGTGATLDLRMTVSVDAGDEDFAVDDFVITGDAPAPTGGPITDATFYSVFDQGFEVNDAGILDGNDGWSGVITRLADGTDGISSPDGAFHARYEQSTGSGGLTAPFTRFDGYRDTWQGEYAVTSRIYLDQSWGANEGFDWSVASNGSDGAHQRDFIFHITKDSDTGTILIAADNNSNFDPILNLETRANFAEVTTSGWFTFQHRFYEETDGTLAVEMKVFDDTGTEIFSETLNNAADIIATEVGGNRYGWFTNIDVTGGILVDDVQLLFADAVPRLGTSGDDTLTGTAEDDTFVASAGNDEIDGGAGSDIYDASAATGSVTVSLASNPFAFLVAGTGFASSSEFEIDGLTSIENFRGGSGDDAFAGDGASNTVFASDGNDTLDGAGGTDTYDASDAVTAISVDLGAGTASGTGIGSDNLTSFENATGGTGHDALTGSAGVNVLSGGAGDDTLDGAGGDDALEGGDGTDTAALAGNKADWTIDLAAGTVTDGTDTISLSSIEVLSFADGRMILVDQGGANGFATIGEAVAAASDGDTIFVAAGTYREQVELDGFNGITLMGEGDSTIIEMADAPAFINATNTSRDRAAVVSAENSTGVTIKDILIDGRGLGEAMGSGTNPDFEGIFFGNSSGTIDDVTVTGVRDSLNPDGTPKGNQRGNAIVVLDDDGAPRSVTIQNSTVEDFQKNGITIAGAGLTANVDANTVTGSGFLPASNAIAQNGIQISGDAGGSITNNTVEEIGYQRGDFVTTGILAFDPADGLVITGNTFTGATDGLGNHFATTHVGVYVIGESDNVDVSNNTFDFLTFGLILSSNFDNPTVAGNAFTNMFASVTTNTGSMATWTGSNIEVYGDGNDLPLDFSASEGSDYLLGTTLDDTLDGAAGDDFLYGDTGNDTLIGGEGNDELDGEAGIDTVSYSGDYAGFDLGEFVAAPPSAPTPPDGITFTDTDTLDGNEGTDTLMGTEVVEFGDGTTVRIVGAGSEYATIQDAVDAADAGDIIYISSGTYAETVTVNKAVTFQGAGVGNTIITPASGSAFDIDGDLGTDATVSIDGISFVGASASGVEFDDNAILGTLQITNSHFEANDRNGVQIGGNYGPVDLDTVVITDTSFVGNGQPSGSSGDGDILFFQYAGDATLQNLTITGQDRGAGEGENAIQFRGDGVAMGNVTLDTVTIDGVYEKVGLAVYGYSDVSGLSATGVTITATTGWGLPVNLDGIGGDIDFSALGIDATGAPGTSALQGNGDAQAITGNANDEVLRGAGGNDTLDGGAGTDTAAYVGNVGDYTIGVTKDASGFVTAFTSVTDDNAGDGDEGADSLSNIEQLSFVSSGTLLDLTQGVQLFDASDNLIGTFDTIQEAVDAASDGQTILLGAGTFTEQVTIDGFTDLTIRGQGDSSVVEMVASPVANAPATNGEAVFAVLNSSNVILEDMKVDGLGLGSSAQFYGTYYENSSGTIDDLTVTGIRAPLQGDGTPQGTQIGRAIFANNTDAAARTLNVTNNTVTDFQKNGIDLRGDGLTVNVTGNTVEGSGYLPAANAIAQNGIVLVFGPTGVIDGNTITEIGYGRGDFVTTGILLFDSGDGVQVTNNVIEGVRDGLGDFIASTHTGIVAQAGEADNLVITGNTLDGVLDGISIEDNIDNPTVSGNIFQNMIASVATTDGNGTFTGANLEVFGNDNDLALSLAGTAGTDELFGTSFADSLDGAGGDDQIGGDAGNDTLIGGDGNDALFGEDGDDALTGGEGDDSLDGGAGIDTAVYAGNFADYTIDLVAGTVSDDVAAGGDEGTDTIGTEILQFADTSVLIVGAGGFATIQAAVDAASAGDTILVAAGTYAENVVISTANLTLIGANAGIAGSGARSAESELTGSIQFAPGANGSTVDGMRIVDGATVLGELVGAYVQADNVTITNSVFERTGTLDFDASRGVLTATGSAAGLTVSDNAFTGWHTGTYVTPGSDAAITGNLFDTNMVGVSNDGPDASSIAGNTFQNNQFEDVGIGATNDPTSAAFVADTNTFSGGVPQVSIYPLAGGSGGQVITGSVNADTFNGDQTDTSLAQSFSGLGGDDLINAGGGADTLDGGEGADTVNAGDGDDLLAGGAGDDSLDGGAGTDTLDESGATAALAVDLAAGTATGDGSDTVTGIENVTTGSGNDTVTGDASDNVITTNGGNDSVTGGDGNDTLDAGAGADTLDGGAGDDSLLGGDGNDLLTASGGGSDTLDGGGGADTLQGGDSGMSQLIGGSGNDQLTGALGAVTLMGGLGADTLIAGSNTYADGGDGNDSLEGSATANETLLGGAGNDTLTMTAGDDLLDGGAGTDLLDASGATANLTIDLSGSASGAGSDTLADIEDLITGSGDDMVTGSSSNNVIDLGSGDDTMMVAGGDDDLDGGSGTDLLDFSNSGQGVTVNLAINAAFGGAIGVNTVTNFENLAGSAFADNLTGDAGDNVFTPTAGNDTIDGGAGIDTYDASFATTAIAVVLSSGSAGGTGFGTDMITNVENFLTGAGADIIFADGTDNFINANDADDMVAGGGGNDTLIGGEGGDTLMGEDGNDILSSGNGADSLSGGAGDDLIVGGRSEDTLDGGAGNDILRGGTQRDLLAGGDGNDVLLGEEAIDTLFGGAGDDTLTGGDFADLFVFSDGWGHDVITDFAAGFGGEKLDFTFVTDFTGPLDVLNNHAVDTPDGVLISDTHGNTLLLQGVVKADLIGQDFKFNSPSLPSFSAKAELTAAGMAEALAILNNPAHAFDEFASSVAAQDAAEETAASDAAMLGSIDTVEIEQVATISPEDDFGL